MKHPDHIRLISKAIPTKEGKWADLGSGEGAFTLALAELVGTSAEIFSVDKNLESLRKQKEQFSLKFPNTAIHFMHQDFTKPLELPPLDGIVMANSLHFLKEKIRFLKNLRLHLKPQGKLIIVEYNVDTGNAWVPYPFSFPTFQLIAQEANYRNLKLLQKIPSQFLNEIYSALAIK